MRLGWHSDGVRGGPSSMDVLLEWLAVPGNADAWLKSVGNKGTRSEFISEIHDLLLSHGITFRTRAGIVSRLWTWQKQLEKASDWLKCRGLRRFDVDKKTERAVLKLCPSYREIASLLRSMETSGRKRSRNYEDSEEETADEGSLADHRTQSLVTDHRSHSVAINTTDFMYAKWESDGVEGRPSSLDVILKWIITPGNAERWQEAARRADGSRRDLANEIYDSLLVHGITHRTRRGVDSKLYSLEQQFDKADNWLRSKGIHHYRATIEAERTVLSICPVYSKIASVLRSAFRKSEASNDKTNDKISKADPVVTPASSSKRFRSDHCRRPPKRLNTGVVEGGAILERQPEVRREFHEGIAILDPKPDERREFFKLELQVKRDQAIYVRAKTRKALLDMGVGRGDVDRLLPL